MTWAQPLAVAFATAVALAASGCDKGNEQKCRAAIRNVLKVTGQENAETIDEDAFVRSCRANSSDESIACLTNAKSIADLTACEGDLPDKMAKKEAKEAAKKAKDEAGKDGDSK